MMSETSLPATAATPLREPWRAANLSLVYAGLGQWEAGERARGLAFAMTVTLLWVVGVVFTVAPRLPVSVGIAALLLAGAIDLLSMVDAHHRARAANSPEQEETRAASRDPWMTVFLNRFLPGLGHAYEGRWAGAALWVPAFLAATALPPPWSFFAQGAVLAATIWHGWTRTRGRPVPDTPLLVAVLLAASVWTAAGPAVTAWMRENLLQAFRIPSAGMVPTLRPGDFVFVDKRPFVPRDGDLVVYPYPQDPSKLFLKRVVALPGEVVEFKPDGAYRDGRHVLTSPSPTPWAPEEILGGEGRPYRVREGEVFLVGDNLANSNDSRYHGPIPIAKLRGRAYKTYWPLDRSRSLP